MKKLLVPLLLLVITGCTETVYLDVNGKPVRAEPPYLHQVRKPSVEFRDVYSTCLGGFEYWVTQVNGYALAPRMISPTEVKTCD